jgi:spore germination protein GerM
VPHPDAIRVRHYARVQWRVSCVLLACIGLAGCTNDDTPERASPQLSTTTTGAATSSAPTATTTPSCVPPNGGGAGRPELDVAVKVFLYCNESAVPVVLHPVTRVVPNDGEPLRAAITQLLLGVTPDEASAGMQSAFGAYTAGTLRRATIKSGVATLDFTAGFERTNNFSTSHLSGLVLSQIEATVFQFPEITGIEYAIEGKRWCGWESGDCIAPVPLVRR